jgi:drug/metabolite transporter (DMT)-like permease
LHPLVVHAAVIFGPIGALTAIAYSVYPRWRDRLRWPMLVLAMLAVASIVAAYLSGDNFLDSRPELGSSPLVQTHEERADWLLWSTIVFGVIAIAAAALHKKSGPVRVLTDILLLLSAVTVVIFVVMTGEAGARAVWGS